LALELLLINPGSYSCHAINPRNVLILNRVTILYLVVAGGPKQFAPTLSFSSQNQTVVVEGQDVTTLYCFFAGK